MTTASTPEIAPGAKPFILSGHHIGVLLIHGYGGSIGDYRELGEYLYQLGYTVMGMRVAGHGQGIEALKRATIADWRNSVTEAADDLLKKCPKIFIIGGSFGGDLAIDYAANHVNQVVGLVVINTPIRYRLFGNKQLQVFRILRWMIHYLPKFKMSASERRRDQELGSVPAWPISGLLDSYCFIDQYVKPVLKNIKVPTLVLRSEQDPWVDVASSQYIFDRIGGMARRIQTIPSQRHNPFRDAGAFKEVKRAVKEFMSDIVATM